MPLRADVSVMAWADADSVWVENAHAHPVEVLAFGPGWAYREEVPPTLLAGQDGFGPPARVAFARATDRDARQVYIREPGQDSIYRIPAAAFAAPARQVPRQELAQHRWPKDKVWRIKGVEHVDRWLRVPPGGRVVAEPGARLVLEAGAGLVMESPAQWLGTAQAPVRVEGMPGNLGLLFLDSVEWRHVPGRWVGGTRKAGMEPHRCRDHGRSCFTGGACTPAKRCCRGRHQPGAHAVCYFGFNGPKCPFRCRGY